MVCPHCGGVIEARRKAELNLGAVWLHEEADGRAVPLAELERQVATASYWLPGPAAALAPWARLVARYLEAEETCARTGDEAALKAVTNVELGLPYLPRSLAEGEALTEARLRDRASAHAWQEVPEGAAFLTAAVDVQKGRFVVQVEAWALDLSRVVVDRFDLVTPPEGAPRAAERALDPGRYAEDWAVLLELADRSWPVAGGAHALAPVAVVVDAGGAPGVTPNAYAFWRRARRSHPRRFHLVRGRGGDRAKRAEVKRPETAHQGKAHVARDVRLIWAGTDRLKDEVAASLAREAGGARKLAIPAGAPAEVFAEYAAERRGAKGWEKRPGVQRNEALDLSVYALALVIVLEAEALAQDNPPAWAVPGPGNQFAVPLGGGAGAAEGGGAGGEAGPAPAAPPPAERPRGGWVVKRPRRR
jgi:phage terminase large subunit GpA-like protein